MNIQEQVKTVIELEIKTLEDLLQSVDESFEEAVKLLVQTNKKVVFSGMGKSGHIAHKIVATFSSTGTPAIFLHPSEALHGDLGIVQQGDVVVLISKSGESDEMIGMIPFLKKIESKIIAITANRESTVAKNSDIVLYTPVEKEACTLNLAPTCSVVSALVVGDALAVALMTLKNITTKDFALYHPAGRIGKRLLFIVRDLMRKEENNPLVHEDSSFEDILSAISAGGANAVSVADKDNRLLGLITGYDIRKVFGSEKSLRTLQAKDIMFPDPITIHPDVYAIDAYTIMKENPKPLNVLPVVKADKVVGMLTLQDMVRAGL